MRFWPSLVCEEFGNLELTTLSGIALEGNDPAAQVLKLGDGKAAGTFGIFSHRYFSRLIT